MNAGAINWPAFALAIEGWLVHRKMQRRPSALARVAGVRTDVLVKARNGAPVNDANFRAICRAIEFEPSEFLLKSENGS